MFEFEVRDGVVAVPETPEWIIEDDHIDKYWARLQRLIRFYCIECPVLGSSNHRVSLAEYGWDAPWKKPQKLNFKLKKASTSNCLYWSAAAYKQMEDRLLSAGLQVVNYDSLSLVESAAFYDAKKNQTLSLLTHIRDSFAHGRFYVFESVEGTTWIVMEDVTKRKKNDPEGTKRLSARILLRIETLESWINLIREGPDTSEGSNE